MRRLHQVQRFEVKFHPFALQVLGIADSQVDRVCAGGGIVVLAFVTPSLEVYFAGGQSVLGNMGYFPPESLLLNWSLSGFLAWISS